MPATTRPTRFVLSLFHTPGTVERTVFYSVVRAGHLVAGPEHRIERDNYPGHELILCLRGAGTVSQTGRKRLVRAGELAWVNCYHPHAYWADARSPWELYWLRVEGSKLDAIWTILSSGAPPCVLAVPVRETGGLFRKVFGLLQADRPEVSALVHAEVARLLAILFTHRGVAGESLAGGERVPPGLRKAVEQMRLYFHKPIRVSELAASAGLSPSHFIRVFRKVMGTSPIDWLRHERATQAKRRLAETDDSVKEIAAQCGYADQFYFSRDFKHLTGLAPTEFRRRERGGRSV